MYWNEGWCFEDPEMSLFSLSKDNRTNYFYLKTLNSFFPVDLIKSDRTDMSAEDTSILLLFSE